MKVFITGISGFLGSHLALALIEAGHYVFGNDNMICADPYNSPIPFADTDCRDFDAMLLLFKEFNPDVVVHCAATAHEGLSSFSPSFITQNIFEASVATFSAAIASGVERIVFMSSMARYGDNQAPFTEDMIPRPVDCYAISKIAAEDALKNLCKTHDVKWSILIPHSIIGTKQRFQDPYRNVASIMINRCLLGKPPIIYGDGLQTRCFSPVVDCIPTILRAVHGHADGEIVNIGPDGGEITIKELAEKIAALTGFDGEFEYHEDRPNEVKHAFCSSDKVKRKLGFRPLQSIDDCLKEMVEYIKMRGPGEFDYSFPLEIVSDKTPKAWLEKLL